MDFRGWLAYQESLALKGNYKQSLFVKLVAASYKLAPISEADAIPCYQDLIAKLQRQDQYLRSKFEFQPTYSDPYPSMKAMSRDIERQRETGVKRPVFKVFADHPGPEDSPEQQGHPAFSNKMNVMLRGVHDAIAHYYGQHPFSARGEFGAYNRHLKTFCNDDQVKSGGCLAAKVLFTEVVGQTSYYYIYKKYTNQKAVILKDFDHWAVGKLNPQSSLNHFFVYQNKDLVMSHDFSWEKFHQVRPDLATELKSIY